MLNKNKMEKPKVQLTGKDGNVFNLLGICTKALKKVGMYQESTELTNKVFGCGSYDEALCVMMEYCDVE